MVKPVSTSDAGKQLDTRNRVARARRAGRRMTVKTRQALSDEQERLRIEGLRALARIIARRALAYPGLYEGESGEGEAGPTLLNGEAGAGGAPDRTGDAA